MSEAVIIEVIKVAGIFATLVVAIIGIKKANRNKKDIQEIHVLINSNLQEMLNLTREAATAKGNLQGRAEQTEENKVKP